jgi:hypothetical protein
MLTMRELLIPLTFSLIVVGTALSILAIWAWRRELARFFGITGVTPPPFVEQEQLLGDLMQHANMERRLIDRLVARQASQPDVEAFEAATRKVAENIPRLKRSLAR